MRKILSLMLLTLATSMLSSRAYAADPDKSLYDAAMAAITDGGTYRITTDVDGTKYYLAADGALTSDKAGSCIYTLTVATGGALYDAGINITGGNGHYSNTTLDGDKALLKPNTGVFRQDPGNDRNDWERQVFYLDEAGKYAIRSCNTAYAESSWADAGRAFWTYEVADATPNPCYSYDAAFVWNLESVVTVTVTYQLVETDGTVVSTIERKQEGGSEVVIPADFLKNIAYSYAYEGGTIGNDNCTITVTRTPKVTIDDLVQLSNEKTYKIACDRGALLTKDGFLASTAHKTLTTAQATEFAVITYKDNRYLYSVADKKFLTNTGELADWPIHGAADAVQMEKRDGFGATYFMFFFNMDETTQYGLNTNGNDPYGYVINNWMTADPGNMYYMVEEAEFDAKDAIFVLENVEYYAAMAAITDGATYRISTDIDGVKYYITNNGGLTSEKNSNQIFTLRKSEGGALFNVGIEIDGGTGKHFSNTTLENDKAVLHFGSFRMDGSNNRPDWERQVFYLDEAGKFAIRSCNTAYGESSWADAGRAFWTYEVADVVKPCYTYDMAYVWTLEEATTVTVTYKLVETDGTLVTMIGIKQESGSEISIPAEFLKDIFYGYSYEGGVIGNEDCTITVTRTPKPVITDLAQLSNNKTYKIACDRGALLTKNGYLASTAHGTLTDAVATEFAVISYENNYYLYSVADKKFLTNTGALAAMPANGTADAVQMERRDGFGETYFMYFFNMDESTQYGLNTNGNDPYGYVINNWMTADPGNMYYMVEEADFDPTDALNALETLYHPSVTIGEAGYATLYLPFAVTLGEELTAFTGKVNEEFLSLAPIFSAVPAYTAVVVKGAPGTYPLAAGDNAINCAKAVELTSALEDNALSEEIFTVEGYITDTDSRISRNQQTFWMADAADGEKVFEAYWANLADGRTAPYEVGTKVRITGKLQKYVAKNGNVTCEIKNADVTLLDNDLKGTFEAIDAEGKYILAKPEGKEVGFYKAEGTIPAGKAYLEAAGADVKGFFFTNYSETGIMAVEDAQPAKENVIFDLSGRRVEKAVKGIYIINGKKVLK